MQGVPQYLSSFAASIGNNSSCSNSNSSNSSSCGGGMKTPTAGGPPSGKPAKATLYTPPKLFACVEAGLWRCKTPVAENVSYLSTLGLKTVICLSLELPSHALRKFMDQHGITFVPLGYNHWRADPAWRLVGNELLCLDALALVLDGSHHSPCLAYCSSGVLLTGCLMALIRKLQGWCFTAILEEFSSFDLSGALTPQCAAFLEHFDLSLVCYTPELAPDWLHVAAAAVVVEEEGQENVAGALTPVESPTKVDEGSNSTSTSSSSTSLLIIDERWRQQQQQQRGPLHRTKLPLVSAHVRFDPKKSLVEWDDD